MSCPSRGSLHQEGLCFVNIQFCMLGLDSEIRDREISVVVWAAISWYSVGPIVTFHSRIDARSNNQVHP
jgi:hypothetical protein